MWRIHLHNCKHLASIDYYRSDLTSQYQLPSNHSQCSLYDLRCKSLHDYDLDGIRRHHLLDEHKYCAVFSYSGKLQNLTNCYSIILWTIFSIYEAVDNLTMTVLKPFYTYGFASWAGPLVCYFFSDLLLNAFGVSTTMTTTSM